MSDQRRQWKRAREILPNLSFRIIDKESEIKPAMSWIMEHKIRWLEKTNKSSRNLKSDEIQRHFLQVAINMHKDNRLVLGILGENEVILSAGYGFKSGTGFMFQAFSYDAKFENISPSRLFLEELVHWCLENGMNYFDFMPGNEAYKKMWATHLVRTDSYAGPLSRRGEFILKWRTWTDEKGRMSVIADSFPQPIRIFTQRSIAAVKWRLGLGRPEYKVRNLSHAETFICIEKDTNNPIK